MIFTWLEWIGALGNLGAFALMRARVLPPTSARYYVVNLTGGAMLAVAGVPTGQWGFVVANGAWTLIAARGLATRKRV